jgi:uncharacterized membrane protein
MSRVYNFVVLLRGQLWIIPALMSATAVLLAYAILGSGVDLSELRGTDLWWLYSGDASTARDLLSTLLSGLVTMTSLVVSVTFVTLTLAANQLGPRLIWNFIGDRQIQAVLGLFLSTILYVLVVLRSLDDTLGPKGVPHVAVTVASVLMVLCLFALLFYVHKIARSIVADTAVKRVATELRDATRDMLLEPGATSEREVPSIALPCAGYLSLGRSGYIQTVDYEALVKVARREDAIFCPAVRAGDFVLSHGGHIEVRANRPLPEKAIKTIRRAFVIGAERSPAQDLEYVLRQLVEIALRALSPGINDPFTAIAVVDRLGAALEDVLLRAMPPVVLRDDEGEVRVIANRSEGEGLIDTAFDQIRQASGEHPAVLIRIADTLAKLAPVLRQDETKGAVLRHLDRLSGTAKQAGFTPDDHDAILTRIEQARAVIKAAAQRKAATLDVRTASQ